MVGGGFLYTAKEALHVGLVVTIETLVEKGCNPSEIMDVFKRHPAVRKLLEGGELLEYSAHMLPEGGYAAIGDLTGNGVLIAGDAAGLLNASLYKEGTNHAMASGRAAGEAVAEAKSRGDFSKEGLAGYEKRLRESNVLQDLRKYRDVPHVLANSPGLLSAYPEKVNRLLVDYFTVTAEPKAAMQRRARREFLNGLPKARFLRDVLRGRRLI
jgi:electron transfer flavoprotein-quinone oxidoreductase